MRNQDFCYWLQGYFEISKEASLTEEKLNLIKSSLGNIKEPLGDFTQWLDDVISYLVSQGCSSELMNVFQPEISDRLNAVFYHVIDNSYDTELDAAQAKRIHDGVDA